MPSTPRCVRSAAWVGALVAAAGLAACGSSSTPTDDPGVAAGGAGWTTLGTRALPARPSRTVTTTGSWTDYNPDADYPKSVSRQDTIEMADGKKLAVTVVLPADADGNAAPGPLPTIVTMTGYNKATGSVVPGLGGANPYLVAHGYAHVIVDVRGTGSSDGQWDAFGTTEQADYRPTLDWVAAQPFCNGNIGLYGGSLLAITAMLSAAQQHPAVKALFPIVPMADGYRDIVFTGGQINVAFIPLWLGFVTALSALDPNLVLDPVNGVPQVLDHVLSAVTNFQVPLLLKAAIDDPGTAYDGDFWQPRSPIEQAPNVKVPTFIVGGLMDIFQRGEPLLYEALKNHTTAKLLIGPWTHIGTAANNGLPVDGVPVLDHIALQWFDQYVKGMKVGADRLPNVTQYVYGHGHFVTSSDWPHPQARAQRLYLHGDKRLDAEPPLADEARNATLQQPLGGICSASTSQWTAGALGLLPLPCVSDDRLAELIDVKYETAPMDADFYINGPIEADIWISTTSPDAGISVRVDDVDPSGAVIPLTNGLLTASLRAVDAGKSRTLDGEMIQPWHPFTQASREDVGSGQPVLLPVEVFPTSAVIAAGHRLRFSIGPSDFPHGLPPLPDLLNSAVGVLTVHSDAEHPSSVVLPVVPASALN
jgi:putative CocE/NonD family hydrolase